MDLLLPVFQFIYFVVHFLYSLAQAVFDCFIELYHIIRNFFWWKKHKVIRARQVLQDASKLKKLPRHLGFILMSKQTNNLKRICYLINWATGFGIPSVSLYDMEGILKLKLPSLLDAMSQTCADVTVKVIVDGQVYIQECGIATSTKPFDKTKKRFLFKTPEECIPKLQTGTCNISKLGESNSNLSASHVILNILCVEDGKDDLVKLAKKSCNENWATLQSDFINSELITKGQIDPDLVVVVGRPICSLGFLPWQIRLTEFLNIPSLSRFDYFEFRRLLQLYSKCEQRFGS